MNCIKLEQYIANHVSKNRTAHLYSTAQQTQSLVARYIPTITPQTGYVVGLWHDATREWKTSDLLDFSLLHNIAMEAEEREYPLLLHGPVAAYLLPQLVAVPLACQTAIRWHTLGSPAMGALGAALYIADYIEPLRSYLNQNQRDAFLAFDSLEEICLAIVLQHQKYLDQRGMILASSTKTLLEFLLNGEAFTQ